MCVFDNNYIIFHCVHLIEQLKSIFSMCALIIVTIEHLFYSLYVLNMVIKISCLFQSEPIYVPLKYDDKSSSSSDINELTGMSIMNSL